jgi:hypothetical protein
MTSPSSLFTIYSNFRNLFYAACSPDEVMLWSVEGSILESGNGVITSIAQTIFGKESQAIQYTAQIYREVQDTWLAGELKSYKKHLDRLRHGCTDTIDEECRSGVRIQEWYQNTWGFIELVESKSNPKMQALLEKHFPGEKQPFYEKYKEQTRSFAAMSRLESLGRMPLPLNDWLLLGHFRFKNKPFTNHDKWLEKLLENGVDAVTHLDVLEGIEGVATYFRSLDLDCTMTASQFFYSFDQKGYRPFISKPDPKHLKWRDRIQVGTSLGKYSVTGIYPEKHGEGNRKVFMLDDTRYVARVFQNCIVPFTFLQSIKYVTVEIPFLEMPEIDPKGRFIIQMRIDDPAADWNCAGITAINDECKEKLQVPIKIMKHFIYERWCPSITLDKFRVISDGSLRALTPYDRRDYWLEPFESYCLELSCNNRLIYSYLIDTIGIKNERMFRCYRGATAKFADGVESYLVESIVASHLRGNYTRWQENMSKLYAQIQTIRKQVLQRYAFEKKATLSAEKLAAAIMSYYDSSSSITQLPRDAEDEIFKLVCV